MHASTPRIEREGAIHGGWVGRRGMHRKGRAGKGHRHRRAGAQGDGGGARRNFMPKYRIVKYYPRAHEVVVATLEAAMARVNANRLSKGTNCYTEIWEMENESDGEQVAVYDPHGYKLEAVEVPKSPTATLNFRP